MLKQCLENLAGRVDELAVHGKDAVRVFGAITVIPDKESVLIEVNMTYSIPCINRLPG